MISRYVDDKLTVVVLTNLQGADSGKIARGIAATYVSAVAEAPEKPVEDKDVALTAKLRAVVVSLADSTISQELFTPEAKAALFPDKAKEAAAFLKPLGALKSFTLISTKAQGMVRALRYKAEFASMTLMFAFAITDDGKVAGIGVMPN